MKLTSEMKEVALQVAQQIAPDGWLCGSGPVLDFAERFLAALPKPEPSAALEALEDMDDFARMNCSVEPIGAYSVLKRFIMNTEPQDTAAIEQRVAEACAKVIRSEGIGFADDDEELNRIAALIDSGKWRKYL